IYNPESESYETDVAYRQRIRQDLANSVADIQQHIGQSPRVMVWPYGAHNADAIAIANELGMSITMTLTPQPGSTETLSAFGRILPLGNPDVGQMTWNFEYWPEISPKRVAHVDLDYVYDENPEQLARNLDRLISRIYQMHITDVYLQAFVDTEADGEARQVYFPNRHLPMRADLFNRVAWQLRTRARVQVWAWMPVLAFHHPDPELNRDWAVKPLTADTPAGQEYHRLSPFVPEARQFIREIYDDLGRHANFAGILFHDDAYLRDTEDGHGVPMSGAEREQVLTDFTLELADVLRHHQPELLTARNLYARPVLQPESQAWFAQSLSGFMAAYDYTSLMAMPWMEQANDPDAWLAQLAKTVLAYPDAREKVVFELQARNWRTGEPIANATLSQHMQMLQSLGVLHLGYYPDDFIAGHPDLNMLRKVFSASDYPYKRP
ncbi:MAG TPA: poly-beta-1,6-N-acetyl-D-glucosamine N-deacetylase PgaB, partial [Marinobacter sp.]|nr:poly-beta-1,6-N-acetyl-D-glucosamine N-deacetylase PgaB [Marinobacter sp.]